MDEAVRLARYLRPRRGVNTPSKVYRSGAEQLLDYIALITKDIQDIGVYLDARRSEGDIYNGSSNPDSRKRGLKNMREFERKIGNPYKHFKDAMKKLEFVRYAFRKLPEYNVVLNIYQNMKMKREELMTNPNLFNKFAEESIKTLNSLGSELYRNLQMAEHLYREKAAGTVAAEKKEERAVPITPILLVLGLTGAFLIYLGYSVSETSAAIAFSPVISVFSVLFSIIVIVCLYFIYRK